MSDVAKKVETLMEAMPYLEKYQGKVIVIKYGFGADFSEELAKKVLTEHDITVIVRFYQGDGEAKAWGCDLTYDYVKINGDYRT